MNVKAFSPPLLATSNPTHVTIDALKVLRDGSCFRSTALFKKYGSQSLLNSQYVDAAARLTILGLG